MFDALPPSAVEGIAFRGIIPDEVVEAIVHDVPSWLDVESVKRGQAVYVDYVSQVTIALSAVLCHGFIVSRFSEVLYLSGYAISPQATYQRFLSTSISLYAWMATDLFDPRSRGFQELIRVRGLHTCARRRALQQHPVWKDHMDVLGLPLSQYDTALVQLSFTGFLVDVLQNEYNLHWSPQEMEDYTHCWRFIGYRLGIEDEYNACISVKSMTELTREFQLLQRSLSPSLASEKIVASLIAGLSQCTVAGSSAVVMLIHATKVNRPDIDISWMRLRTPNKLSLRLHMHLRRQFQYRAVRYFPNAFFRWLYGLSLYQPNKFHEVQAIMMKISSNAVPVLKYLTLFFLALFFQRRVRLRAKLVGTGL